MKLGKSEVVPWSFVGRSWDKNPDAFLIEEMQFYLEELEFLQLEMVCNQM